MPRGSAALNLLSFTAQIDAFLQLAAVSPAFPSQISTTKFTTMDWMYIKAFLGREDIRKSPAIWTPDGQNSQNGAGQGAEDWWSLHAWPSRIL